MKERRKYFDKNGTEIKAGMTIRHDNGDLEKIYECGEDELGVNASNENHPNFVECYRECYPLWQFCMSEWEVVIA